MADRATGHSRQRPPAVLPEYDRASTGLDMAGPVVTGPAVKLPGVSGSAPPHAIPTRAVAAKAANENFPVALRMLPRTYRRHLMAVYVFARTADDLGDQAPAAERLRLLADLEADVQALYAGLSDAGELAGDGVRVQPAVAGL